MAKQRSFAIELTGTEERLRDVVKFVSSGIEDEATGFAVALRVDRLFNDLDPCAELVTVNLRRRPEDKTWADIRRVISDFTADEEDSFPRLAKVLETSSLKFPTTTDEVFKCLREAVDNGDLTYRSLPLQFYRFHAWIKHRRGEGELWKHRLRFSGTLRPSGFEQFVGRLCQAFADLECEACAIDTNGDAEHWVNSNGVLCPVEEVSEPEELFQL